MVKPSDRGPIDLAATTPDNAGMEIPGRVQNGVVVLQDGNVLPEGAEVVVSYQLWEKRAKGQRVQLPLIHTGNPGTLHLTNERIAEILDEEDASPLPGQTRPWNP